MQLCKGDDPIWLPAKNWESLNRENERSLNPAGMPCEAQNPSYNPFIISEESLVRVTINAMHGIQSAISTIDNLSAAFCSEFPDMYLGVSALWSPCSTTHSLGKLLNCLGYSGRLVFILQRFSDYLTGYNSQSSSCDNEVDGLGFAGTGLVNQAFGVALNKILQGYAAALDTLLPSVECSHHSSAVDLPPFVCSEESRGVSGVIFSKMTVLKVYLHTQELRNHISVTGSICNVIHDFLCSSELSVKDLGHKCWLHFSNFPRGGDLLTYLYTKIRNADRPQYPLLKFFFIQSCEPFCHFVRSWIYEAEIADPFGEFFGKKVENLEHSCNFDDMDSVDLPCFLHGVMLPFSRAGKQLKFLRKLLQFCSYPGAFNDDFSWILPHWNKFSCRHLLFPFSLRLSMREIQEVELEMSDFYERLLHKLDNSSLKFNFIEGLPFQIGGEYAFYVGEATSSLSTVSESCASIRGESSSTSSQDTFELEMENQNVLDEHDYSSFDFEKSYFSSLMQLKVTEDRVSSQKPNLIGKPKSRMTNLENNLFISDPPILCNPLEIQDMGLQDDHPWFFVHPQRNLFPFSNIGNGIETMVSYTNFMTFENGVPNFSTIGRIKSASNNNSECNFFDFSCVEDACTMFIDKLSSKIVQNSENCLSSHCDPASGLSSPSESESYAARDNKNSENGCGAVVTNEKSWTGTTMEFGGDAQSMVSLFDMSIDFVISRCIWREILLQYKYVSKLAMKMFDEVFHLTKHLLTVRRYLFLEVADWVDSFASSLCQCKCQTLEENVLTSMVQGMLEASLEKSSCRGDPNRGRLYVYFKGDITVSHIIGVHSFEFIGLGYRAGWPVNTILSTCALEKYTEIFSFLIHLDIAINSLNKVWASLSGVLGFHRILSNMRYHVHHFVFTLQQHIQSQLNILWVAFIRYMELKTYDIMDVELMHMAYLNRALHACFLTDETRRVGHIIGDVVQHAFDFGNLLHDIKWNNNGDLNIGICNGEKTRILNMWSEFNKGIGDLYAFFQRSPEHINFDASCFWDQLDYNGYYSRNNRL